MTISAKLIAHSSSNYRGIATFELEYPRMIHAELMTHRLFSRNAASSRAIPIEMMLEMVETNPAMPEEWGINQPGMQAKSIMSGYKKATAEWLWRTAAKVAVTSAKSLHEFGLHKQIVNRIVEPFSHIKVVVTATEYDNWFWLRDHEDAQPEIRILAQKMLEELSKSSPVRLRDGDWHTPYFDNGFWTPDNDSSLEDALAISSSCCAQVSFRTLDDTLDKARRIYARLVESEPVHASPFEHQATPLVFSIGKNDLKNPQTWQEGITHFHKEQGFGSGNFYGFIQHRQLLKGHSKWRS